MSKEKLDNGNEELENGEWDEEEIEVYTLEDEDGNESDFTLIKRMDIDGQSYVAFEPFDEEEMEDEEDSFVILKVMDEEGEEVFITIEDDDEFDKVADIFEDQLMEEMPE
jgi:uncharacterized protein YrzB (UPF0473 family)